MPTIIIDIHEAGGRINELVDLAHQGREVVIMDAGRPTARLVSAPLANGKREFGKYRGKIKIADAGRLPGRIIACRDKPVNAAGETGVESTLDRNKNPGRLHALAVPSLVQSLTGAAVHVDFKWFIVGRHRSISFVRPKRSAV